MNDEHDEALLAQLVERIQLLEPTALELARLERGSSTSATQDEFVESILDDIRALVRAGACPYAPYPRTLGWTALHYAAETGFAPLVQYFLQNGAVLYLLDSTGRTAGDIAFSLNYMEAYNLILQEATRAELLQAALNGFEAVETDQDKSSASDLQTFLKTPLTFAGEPGNERCMDAEGNGVMMRWEEGIMAETARLLCSSRKQGEPFAVLNVGFGLGIVDTFLQESKPTKHVIIEAHPDVLGYMRSLGWHDKPGVLIYHGTWQAFLLAYEQGELASQFPEGLAFDAVYFDTFSEHYRDLRQFFDQLPNILRDQDSLFSWFHGLGATSRLLYDVYTAVSELELRDIGLSTEWTEVAVEDAGEVTWKGITRRYWDVASSYRLPICRLR
ncbi:uncharacterized protein L969DRAFT_116319 [Mixia osmundae IAM 14324]|uniref:Arginine N-methyltransferase 2 n=1 Tax=Mixia osmundae (strain CBS 9802 / IAM 14324 / JCM 22182 / KY 12970) TaxID=764103 RepID=G7E3P8_MIXOS|nr:uncharacterized protein L969DRAFT_116319 [Mixia osmundae IAM 14324]KEI41882.1 hypothetical protein L969DRAFT_116319 [Mixia osmundae IAM 14324]GAA97458.1 hypothetical protein E5Q_04137 [Mixia osmundae IAM 14324]